MITPEEKKALAKRFEECQTLGEIFRVATRLYDLDKNKLGPITKIAVVQGAIKAIELCDPPKK